MADTDFQVGRIKERLQELELSLEQSLPGMSGILADIHKTLQSDHSIVTLLTEEEISTIVRGLESHAGTAIPVPKKAASKKTPITADDL